MLKTIYNLGLSGVQMWPRRVRPTPLILVESFKGGGATFRDTDSNNIVGSCQLFVSRLFGEIIAITGISEMY